MVDRKTASSILRGAPIVVLVGIIGQIVSLLVQGPTTRYAEWYIALMATLLVVNISAYVLHHADRTRQGILLAAWGGLVCVSALVILDILTGRCDYPWIVYTLIIAAFAVGGTLKGGMVWPYTLACGGVMALSGVVMGTREAISQAFTSLCILFLFVVSARGHFSTFQENAELSEAIRIVTNAKRGPYCPDRSDTARS